ncbi:hypothetical protein [Nocardia sp. NRRL S-836]|uniref:hypothetical protein n=1 Tax=Nocardia sp. NRRL S-836 TaxID=1519492 RepID=UPI0006AF68CD|nr:hypothetical protein [Nocardia sp. NRRL S-836]KOV77443.1 hypothetical protein ADL03_41685 [Nocardia sp. NRRL S-836]
MQISLHRDLAPEAPLVLDTLLHDGIALPVTVGAVVIDVEQAAQSLWPVLNTPAGIGGDRKLGALALLACSTATASPHSRHISGVRRHRS